MPRIASLSILTEQEGKDFLAERYGNVINNISRMTISGRLKNTDLSGDPTTGTLEAKRFTNSASDTYGTARAGGKGKLIKAKPVVVAIDIDKEIVEEVEEKDVRLYGVDGMVERRVANHGGTMERELERAFFKTAADTGVVLTPTATETVKALEEVIDDLVNTKNDYVDGVPRDLITVTVDTSVYTELRDYIDTVTRANVDTTQQEINVFRNVRIGESTYLPDDVSMIVMVQGSVAQPVVPTLQPAAKIQFSNAFGFGIFYSYGTKEVMPDLIRVVKKGA